MNETLTFLVAGAAGAALGTIFFGGLWWTVRRGVSSPRPALWFFGSLLLRMSIVLAGFYVVGRGNGERLVACLLGFIIARFLVMRLSRGPIERQHLPAKGAPPLTAGICSRSFPKRGDRRGGEAPLFPAQSLSPRPSPHAGGEGESQRSPAKEESHAP